VVYSDFDTLPFAAGATLLHDIYCGSYAAANAQSDELIALADEKGLGGFKGFGMANKGWLLALTDRASGAVHRIASGIDRWRSAGPL
jgi:hypothetical protein